MAFTTDMVPSLPRMIIGGCLSLGFLCVLGLTPVPELPTRKAVVERRNCLATCTAMKAANKLASDSHRLDASGCHCN